VRVIGVDLAWGPRGRTGLCAVDGGRVLDSASVVADDDIDAWIRRWWARDLLLAIDAPIVVDNETGARPCEWVLGCAYGPERAAPLPANRSMASFRAGTRARALAERHGFDVDPLAVGRRPLAAAIEVFPHAALVSLFGLSTSLKYKARRHRDRAARRRAFEDLLDCLGKLAGLDPALDVSAGPRWPALVEEVAGARSGAVLDRVEDELDAHVCAYVGLYHLAWRGTRSLVVGDAASGYIVTPVDAAHADAVRARASQRGVPVA
jgi:predicted RNase H-like nuclease